MTDKTHPAGSTNEDDAVVNSEEDVDITPAAVLAQRLSLRTGLMWSLVGALILGLVVTTLVSPKMGAYYFAMLMVVVGTMRWVLPGHPFGIAARERKWVDVVFCYLVAVGLVFLATTSYALRCEQGLFC